MIIVALRKDPNENIRSALSFDGPTCDACGYTAPSLTRLDNGDMEPWLVCEECSAEDAGAHSKVINLRRYRTKR